VDDILFRQAPHSLEAEQSVLGSLLVDSRYVSDVIGLLRAEDFYLSVHRDMFSTIYSMFSYALVIDPVTVLEQMRVGGVWREDSPAYIRDLMLNTPSPTNVLEYAAIVRDKSLLRAIADAGGDINSMAISGEGGAMTILEAAEKKIYALRQSRSREGLEPISKVLVGVYKQINEASKSGGGLPGLTTGFHDLDRFTMGLNKSDFIIVASRPGMGKTSIALNIALHCAKSSGQTVAFFSLEMSREQLATRLLSSESFIDGKKLQVGRIRNEEWGRLAGAAASISVADLLINDDASLSVTEMNAQCRRITNLGLVVVDYLQLMQSATGNRGNQGDSRVQVVSEISRMMKIMAKELNVPVICASQLSRANETRQNKRPLMSDLRESGSIEQDADVVIALYRDDYYNKESDTPNIAECIVLKNRRGETGTIELQWMPEFTTFSSLDKRHQDEV